MEERSVSVSDVDKSKSAAEPKNPTPGGTPDRGGAGKGRAPGGELGGGENLDKVRDILFGGQMRSHEKRFSRLEDRLTKDIMTLREETRKQFESLESYMRNEVESLLTRLKTEQSERAEAVKELTEGLKEASASLERKLSQLDERLDKNTRDLRQQILTQSKDLTEEIRRKSDALSEALDESARELRTDKVDRSSLSDLFAEMAMRLTNDMALQFDLDGEVTSDE